MLKMAIDTYYREFTMIKLRTLVCPHCQSENITRDGLLRWSPTLQAWEMSSELDNMTCDDCGEDLEFADWYDSDLAADAATKSHELTDTQRDTILAALRYWQMAGCISRAASEFEEVATNGGTHPPLTSDQIDILCEQINIGRRR